MKKLTTKQRLIKFLTPILYPAVRMYWKVFKPETQGVKVIISYKNLFLSIRHTYGRKKWNFPGGKIEKNERPEEAATREVLEETGLKINKLRFVDKIVSTSEGKIDNIFIFHAEADNDKVVIDPFEIEEFCWFENSQILDFGPISKQIWSTFNSYLI